MVGAHILSKLWQLWIIEAQQSSLGNDAAVQGTLSYPVLFILLPISVYLDTAIVSTLKMSSTMQGAVS